MMIFIVVIFLISIACIIYKNDSNSIWKINLIDIMLLIAPIILPVILHNLINNVSNIIAKNINKKKDKEIEKLTNKIKEYSKESDIIYEIKDILINSENLEETIIELKKDDKYRIIINKMNIEDLISNKDVLKV